MKFPQMDEYSIAVQNPRFAFSDPELQGASVELNQLGLPKVTSGGFALTYRLNTKTKAWAVRTFHKDVPNRQQRYDAISRFLTNNRKEFLVAAEYLPSGILVNSSRYPITKMPWVQGERLDLFIERNINSNPSLVRQLAEQFRALISQLEQLGIAHGDLQHGNILISQGKLVLVDYDGMYVPALAGYPAEERGNINYQHPQRNSQFGADIDRFSAIVIYMALKAMTPALWRKYGTGENLLFSQDDFRTPQTSRLFVELEAVPEFKLLVQRFRVVCQSSLVKVPRLAEFLSGHLPTTVPEPIQLPARYSQYKVLDAAKRDELLGYVGQRVTVVGKITEISWKRNKNDQPYVFVNFGSWQNGNFRLILWSDTLQLLEQQGKSTTSYSQKWVSVTGLLEQYRGNPQITIESPSEIEVLTDKEEANERLSLSTQAVIETGSNVQQYPPLQRNQPVTGQSIAPSAADKISDLYENWGSPTTPSHVTTPSPTQVSPKPPIPHDTPPAKLTSPTRSRQPLSTDKKGYGDEFRELLGSSFTYQPPQRGDIRKATILHIDSRKIIVDMGARREGIVPVQDLERLDPKVREALKVGAEVPVYVINPRDQDDNLIVSINMGLQQYDWEKAHKLLETKDAVEVTVKGHNQGGILVNWNRLEGFVPGSHLVSTGATGGRESWDYLIGKEMAVQVIEVDQARHRLVFSEREAHREWRAKQMARLLSELEEGDVVRGTISELRDFGAFVNLGGADGLIHNSELAWHHVEHPRDVLHVGEEIDVYVLNLDRNANRIALSRKRLLQDPWEIASERYHEGQRVEGTVTNVVDFGAFVVLDDGLEGLLKEPHSYVKKGDRLSLRISHLEAEKRYVAFKLV